MPDNALFDLTATDADDYPHDEQLASEQPDASLAPHQDAHEDELDVRPGPEDEDFERALAEFDLEQPQREAPSSSAWDDAEVGAGSAAAVDGHTAAEPQKPADADRTRGVEGKRGAGGVEIGGR